MPSRLPALLLLVVSAGAAACAPKLMKLPAVPGTPALDAGDALAAATAACRDVKTLSAELAVSGSVASRRARGRLLVGVAAPASARIEAVAPFGQPMFILVARDRDATLLLPRDERVLRHGAPDAVLEAVAGVALDAEELRRVITACPDVRAADQGRAPDANWRVVADGRDQLYLHRESESAPWQLVAMLHDDRRPGGWRAEYRDFQGGLPRTIRLVSAAGNRFDLRLALSQVDVNAPMGDEVFQIDVPADARPITIDELREAGPFARPGVRED